MEVVWLWKQVGNRFGEAVVTPLHGPFRDVLDDLGESKALWGLHSVQASLAVRGMLILSFTFWIRRIYFWLNLSKLPLNGVLLGHCHLLISRTKFPRELFSLGLLAL